tara:strand:- start:845 stop:1480 length:636 start_codon:yes stop_codon:yes gene_type:complete
MNDLKKISANTLIKTDANSFIEVYDNLASDDYCDRMVTKWEHIKNKSSNNELIGNRYVQDGRENFGAKNRKDFSFFFHTNSFDTLDLAEETNNILNEAIQRYCDVYPSFAMLNVLSQAIKVQKTPPKGGFYSWHCEQKDGESVNRVLAWTIYLNDIPEGEGETEFLELGMKLRPKKGTVCLFPASWTHTHRGNPVYTTDKYIATGWFYLTQ